MKKYILFILIALLFSNYTFAQVGINTTSPQSTLDIRGKNDTGSSGIAIPGTVDSSDGILVPRVSSLSNNGSVNGQLVYLVTDSGSFTKGFYYWSGSLWTPFSGGTTSINDQTIDVTGLSAGLSSPNTFSGASFSPNTPADSNYIYINTTDGTMWTYNGSQYLSYVAPKATEWYLANGTNDAASNKSSIIYRTGSIGIGANNSPYPSAILDLTATDKGILLPRVALTNSTDVVTVPSPAVSMLVFNNGTGGLKYKGVVYWNGTEWRAINNHTSSEPSIVTLNCGSAYLSPSTYTAGVSYSGVLKIPYTNGDGGLYQEGATITINGLNIKLSPGELETGNGNLTFSVWGTPTVSSPTSTTFPIQGSTGNNLVPFLNSTLHCSAVVGAEDAAEITQSATLGPLFLTNDPAAGYHRYVTSPDGKFSVRVVVALGSSVDLADLQIRSNIGTPTIMWNAGTYYVNGTIHQGNNGMTFPAAGKWYGNGGGNGTTLTQSITEAWGDPDVYYGSPEYRRYTWTTTNSSDKTMYTVTFMMGAATFITTNAANCPSGVCNSTKAFLKIEQIRTP